MPDYCRGRTNILRVLGRIKQSVNNINKLVGHLFFAFSYTPIQQRIQHAFKHAGSIALGMGLLGCAASATAPATVQALEPVPAHQAVAVAAAECEPEIDLLTEAAMRKLQLGNEWHLEKRYTVSLEAYEAVLAEHASLLADAYALSGILALRLDRDNPDYSRESAQTVGQVLQQRIEAALQGEAAQEARLLWFAAQVMLEADVSKDKVVADNRYLRAELAQRDEALQRLRELTVGR